jgi:hypothetical protein
LFKRNVCTKRLGLYVAYRTQPVSFGDQLISSLAGTTEGTMRYCAVLIAVAMTAFSCSPGEEVTGSTNKCATDLYHPYNPKVLKQCVEVCIKCYNGVMTTCSTSCTLKGAY